MPYYEVTETLLFQLKDAIENGKVAGVGMLSHFLNIYIDQSWQYEDVVVSSMYFPDDRISFDFPRRRCYITSDKGRREIRYDLPGRRTEQERRASRTQSR